MPYIEEQTLVNLNSQVQKSQQTNDLLLNQIKAKERSLRQANIIKRLYQFIAFICLAAIASLVVLYYKYPEYIMGRHLSDYFVEIRKNQSLTSENSKLKESLAKTDGLAKELQEYIATSQQEALDTLHKKEVEDKPTADTNCDSFFDNKTVYSVQIGLFRKYNLMPYSKGFSNFRGTLKGNLYSYSIGNFATREESQKFRNALANMGFKDAYVIKYVNGKEEKP